MKTLKEIYDYRQMIFSLVRRDLRGRYKRSVLGFLWTFINPLLQIFVYTIVFNVILRNGIERYYLFLFVALIPWIAFSSSMTGGSKSVIGQSSMVKKIYFPCEVLPIAYVTSNFVNMLYCFIVVFAVILFAGVHINWFALCVLPFVIIVEYVISLAVAMFVSSVTVYFRDLEHILGILAMALQYFTPVMYKIDNIPENILPIFMLNPMTSVITAYRDILYYGQIPAASTLLQSLLTGIVMLIVTFAVFGKLKRHFAEEM
jgi:ABC-2 type transport system permease protein